MFISSTYSALDATRKEVSKFIDPHRKNEFGQFLTSNSIASFMASLFTYTDRIRVIDPGAGIGSLTSAFLENSLKHNSCVNVEAWEIDASLIEYLDATIKHWQNAYTKKIDYVIHQEDFIEYSTFILGMVGEGNFTHAILNPPYKKIKSNSKHRLLLRTIGIETVNLYSAFIAVCIKLLENNGELVAIVPRSFCNGTYYLPFRKMLLENTGIKQIHLFKSRDKAFSDDDVLQENIIIHLVKGAHFNKVKISTSNDAEFHDYIEHIVDFTLIVDEKSKNKFIHIPSENSKRLIPAICTNSLDELQLEVSTGPVVDFRVKEYLQRYISKESIPLLYPFNFVNGKLIWPKEHKRPNILTSSEVTKKLLFPNGHYVLVKRFSSKEEKKRIVAYYLSPEDLDYNFIGIENHLNVFHCSKSGIDEFVARGLAVFLNSTLIDNYFRLFSGHTQVNATDLRAIRYPSIDQLILLGKKSLHINNDQLSIDKLIKEL